MRYRKRCGNTRISIHALLAESDIMFVNLRVVDGSFLSTLSLRRATELVCGRTEPYVYFYPRSPCGERHDTSSLMKCQVKFLSTLSLRRATSFFNAFHKKGRVFLSTLSLRRATWLFRPCWKLFRYFYPRSPCGERLGSRQISAHRARFLSTLSLRRATWSSPRATMRTWKFLSTLSLRRATVCSSSVCTSSTISIHALLAESDHSPYRYKTDCCEFLSTLSLRRATTDMRHRLIKFGFLSTLSLRRATVKFSISGSAINDFYPRSPCGERRAEASPFPLSLYFYPRSPCGERPIRL